MTSQLILIDAQFCTVIKTRNFRQKLPVPTKTTEKNSTHETFPKKQNKTFKLIKNSNEVGVEKVLDDEGTSRYS